MTNQTIAPVLTAADLQRAAEIVGHSVPPSALGGIIAAANHLLPDGHPLKITHGMARDIYHAALALPENSPHLRAALLQHADALAALLPPETDLTAR